MTYRAELSGRALKQMRGLTSPTFDRLIEAMAEVIDHPDDPLRTFPTSDPNVRRVEFGEAGLITHLIATLPDQSSSSTSPGLAVSGGASSVEDPLPPRNADARASNARGGRRGRWPA